MIHVEWLVFIDKVKRLLQHVREKAPTSEVIEDMGCTGIKICKLLLPSSEKLEEVLFKGKRGCSDKTIYGAIRESRGPFRKLEMFKAELEKMASSHMSKSEVRNAMKDKKNTVSRNCLQIKDDYDDDNSEASDES